jgi:hypothetical protein
MMTNGGGTAVKTSHPTGSSNKPPLSTQSRIVSIDVLLDWLLPFTFSSCLTSLYVSLFFRLFLFPIFPSLVAIEVGSGRNNSDFHIVVSSYIISKDEDYPD